MALSETAQLLIKVSAQNGASAALNQLHNEFGALKTKILEVAAAFGVGLGLKSIVDETKQWAEQTRGLQAELGVSAEAASRLNYAAQVFGISTEELNTGLGRLAKNMFSASVEADKGKSAFDKWGISVKNANGSTRDIMDVLGQAAGQVQRLGDGAAARALEMDIFGRAGGKLHELMLQGAAGVQELVKESDALGLTLNGQSLQAMYDFSIQSNKLSLAFDGLKVALGQALLPFLTALVQNLTKFVQWVIDATHSSQLFAGVIKALGEAFRYVGGLIKEFVEHVKTFADTIGTKGFGGAVLDLAGALKDMLLKALGDVGEKLDSFGPWGTIAKDALLGLAAAEVLNGIGNVALALKGIASTKVLITVDLILLAAMVDQIDQTRKLIEANPVKMKIAWEDGSLDNLIGKMAITVALGISAAAIAISLGLPLAVGVAIGAMATMLAFAFMDDGPIGRAVKGGLALLGLGLLTTLTVMGGGIAVFVAATFDGMINTAIDAINQLGAGWNATVGELTGVKVPVIAHVDLKAKVAQAVADLLAVQHDWSDRVLTWTLNIQGGEGQSPDAAERNACINGGGTWTNGHCVFPNGTPHSYASGTSYVPRTGLALLHQGEAVIPAAPNRGSVGGMTINFNAPISANSPQEVAEAIGDEIMRSIGHSRSLAF